MKKIVWENPNKMHMDSGFKLFDKQTNVISTGNVFATTQRSVYIAPYREITRNHAEFPEGYLMRSDLKFGGFTGNLPLNIKHVIYDKDREKSVILYAFRVFKNGREDIIGYVITDDEHNYMNHCIVGAYTNASYVKRKYAVEEAMKYVCNGLEEV